MLILKRFTNEGITIFENGEKILHITVTEVIRYRVKIGFEADSRFVIMRDELLPINPETKETSN